MNLLSHLYLSFDDPAIMIGNLLGDDVRGDISHLHPEVRRGVELHRRIDSAADAHPAFLRAAKLLSPNWRHWSRVIIDVHFDHVLARQWPRWNELPLREYLDLRYEQMTESMHLAEQYRPRLERLIEGDLLYTWNHPDGVEASLRRISARSKRKPPLHQAMSDLLQFDEELTREFEELFPDMIEMCLEYLQGE